MKHALGQTQAALVPSARPAGALSSAKTARLARSRSARVPAAVSLVMRLGAGQKAGVSQLLLVAIVLALAATLSVVVPNSSTTAHAATSSASVTIRYMFWGGESEQQAVEQLIKMFRASNPDIQVTPENTPYPEYGDKVPILLASGAGPDVIMLPPYLVPALAAAGALAPLDPFLAQDHSFTLDDFVAPARDIFRFGSLAALPREFGPYVLFYNRSMFEAKGLTEPDWNWDWQALVSAGRKLTTDRDGDGLMDEYGFGGVGWINHYLPFIWQAGGDVIERSSGSSTPKVTIDSPASVRGMQFYADLMLKERINPTYEELERGRVDIEQWFAHDKLAMYPNSRIAVQFFNSFKNLDYDVAPMPRGPATYAALVDPAAIAIVATTKHRDAAWRFLKWLVGPEASRWMSQEDRLVPALLSVVRSPAFLDPQVRPSRDMVFVEMMQYGRTVPLIPQWNEVAGIIGQGMVPVLRGQVSAEQAARTMATRIRQTLARPVRWQK